MLATSVETILLSLFGLAMFTLVGCGFAAAIIWSIYTGRFKWRNDPEPIERAKNPIAFWLSLVPFVCFVGMIIYAATSLVIELCSGRAK